jgi:O-antigen/teichoic acid export membrane protein
MLKIFRENRDLTKQTLVLFVSQIINLLLGITIDVINTRVLGKESFGTYSFIYAFVFQMVLFFDFGIFFSGSRLLAFAKNEQDERNLNGALLIITLFIGILFCLIIFISGYFVDYIFNTNVGRDLRSLSLLMIVFPFQALIPMICRGANMINKLALYNILPKIIYIILIFLFIKNFNYLISFALLSVSTVLATIIIIIQMKPGFNNLGSQFASIKKESKEYGSKIYVGNIINNLSQYFDRLMISYFINTTTLGFYSIAIRMTNQIRVISSSLSVSAFKEFAGSNQISKSILKINVIMILGSAGFLLIINPFLIEILFGSQYSETSRIIPVLVLAMAFGGLTYPYNSFLHVKKQGSSLRNIAVISPLVNIVLNLIFIPVWGISGAAWALVCSLFVSYLLYLFYYKRSLHLRQL